MADEARLLTNAIAQAGIEFVSVRSITDTITDLSLELDHPAYDCAYIALALHHQCPFATADRRLIEVIRRGARRDLDQTVVLFTDLVQSD
jgi:predicted nucleic acid-binding protein